MAPSYSILRSRVTRSDLRFESGSTVSEEVFECNFVERSAFCWVNGANFFGAGVIKVLRRYLGLRDFILREARVHSGKFVSRVRKSLPNYSIFSRYIFRFSARVGSVGPDLLSASGAALESFLLLRSWRFRPR